MAARRRPRGPVSRRAPRRSSRSRTSISGRCRAAFRNLRPLWKYSWPDGEQVYVSENTGEVVQYTTTGVAARAPTSARFRTGCISRRCASTGSQWSRVVIWSSGIGTARRDPRHRHRRLDVFAVEALSLRRRADEHPVSRPEALAHGVRADLRARRGDLGVQRHAVDGSVSAAPAVEATGGGMSGRAFRRRCAAGCSGAFAPSIRGRRSRSLPNARVKELELTSFDGEPVYLATLGGRRTHASCRSTASSGPTFDPSGSSTSSRTPPGPPDSRSSRARSSTIGTTSIDAGQRPLPVILARAERRGATRYYIDPRTARVVGTYSSSNWMSRWLYHGLHSLDSRGSTTIVPPGTSSSSRSCWAEPRSASRR